MNRDAMPRRHSALAPLLIRASCQSQDPDPRGPSRVGVDLRGAAVGGDVTLLDKMGQPVRWGDFAGKPLGTLPTDRGPKAVAEELAGWVR